MGRGYKASAYRDMDEEFFSTLEGANYESYHSPSKKSSSEITILQRHLTHRRALRTNVVVGLSCLLLVGVGSTALYSTVDMTASALVLRGPSAPLRGTSHTAFRGQIEPSDVLGGDAFPAYDDVRGDDVQHTNKNDWVEKAQEDLLLDKDEPNDYELEQDAA